MNIIGFRRTLRWDAIVTCLRTSKWKAVEALFRFWFPTKHLSSRKGDEDSCNPFSCIVHPRYFSWILCPDSFSRPYWTTVQRSAIKGTARSRLWEKLFWPSQKGRMFELRTYCSLCWEWLVYRPQIALVEASSCSVVWLSIVCWLLHSCYLIHKDSVI